MNETNSFLLNHTIHCKWSGVKIGQLEIKTVAGALPYLSHWNECVAMHPLFSLGSGRLLPFMHKEWQRLHDRVTAEDISAAEEEILCVGYLAMLHELDSIKQDFPCLPPLTIVQDTIGKLFALAFWKWKLESLRFRFPTFHISKHNKNFDFSNITHYLDTCFSVKDEYEHNVREAEEKEKVAAAERAMKALNATWIAAPSSKILWRWVSSHLATSRHADDATWIGDIFCGGQSKIIAYDDDELKLMEEIILSVCPPGTGLLKAVRERLEVIQRKWDEHHRAFDIVLEDFAPTAGKFVNGVAVAAPDPGPEPQQRDFGSKAAYFVAHAKWSLAKAAYEKQQRVPSTNTSASANAVSNNNNLSADFL